MKEVAIKWTVHENLLQWYRSIFISSQSFLLVVGTLFLERKQTLIFWLTSAISILIIWFIWFPVVRSRHRIVDYCKEALKIDNGNPGGLCTEEEYVKCKEKRDEATKNLV